MTSPSPADCIGQYIKLRNFVAAEDAKHAERMSPYHAAMSSLEAWGMAELNQIAGDDDTKASIATPRGTVYRKKVLSIKVDDREAWMDFIFDGRREGFLTAAVSKEAVQEYMDQFKSVPPGIATTWIRKTLFNSPKG